MSSFDYKYLKILTESDKKAINTGNKSFWQSSLWTEILIKTHQAKDIILCTTKNSSIIIERRKILRNYTGLYILGVGSDLISEEFLNSLKEQIITSNDLFLQIEPVAKMGDIGCEVSDDTAAFPISTIHYPISHTAPFRRFIEPVTGVLNLKSPGQGGKGDQKGSEGVVSEEKLMASFAEKGRYNIRLAQKRGVTTKWVKHSDKESQSGKTYLELFYNLLEETTERDGFSHNSLGYYKYFVEVLESENAGGLLIAEKDGIIHAAGIFAYTTPPGEGGAGGVGIYYYGASSSDKEIRRDMATYKLQWDAITEAMKRGCHEYDFLGISHDGKGKLAGVTEFKLRFNPEKKHLPVERVIVYRPILLAVLRCVSTLRKFLRKR